MGLIATAERAQTSQDRVCDARLKAARERRVELDPDRVARDRRIDDAVVDVEKAWDAGAVVERAVVKCEVAAAEALGRLLDERLSADDVVRLTGLDSTILRKLRRIASS